jgi:putative ABC transport system substrate-binding protein
MHTIQRNAITTLSALAITTLVYAMPIVSAALAADKTIHIGILSSGSLELRGGLEQALLQGLREQGYVEGKNLVIERRYSSARMSEQIPQFARQLAGMKLDAIITTCSPSTRAAKQATTSTPIVMAAVSDPVGQGIIASLARPGQNVTGRASQAEELLAIRLELLSAFISKSTTIAVLVRANNPVHALGWPRLESAAQQLNLKLMRVDVLGADGIQAGMEAAAGAHAGAVFVMPDDPLFYNMRARIVELAAKYHMPGAYWASDYVEAGGLMSYGENLRDSYRGAGAYIDKVANGANPANLPVAQPTRFELVVNARTARTLGIKIPDVILLRADKVIE